MDVTERKRAGMFDGPDDADEQANTKLNLARFTPKPAPKIDPKAVVKIAEESGFNTKHAKPNKEQNETTKRRDGRTLKKSPRTTQFNVRLQPHTAERFWVGAENEGFDYADQFLIHLLELYDLQNK